MASQPVANCGSGLKPLTDNNTLAERLNMSVTQSTMKISTRHMDECKTYYGFADYDGSTTHIAVVKHGSDVTVYQLDPECWREACEQLELYLYDFKFKHFGFEIAVHVQPNQETC